MAAIIFKTAHQAKTGRGRLQTALTALREILDAVVVYRMRVVAVADADRVGPPQPEGPSSPAQNPQ